MSGLIVGLVLELPVTKEFTSEVKFTATIYADHAWQDGTHAYPAIATVAKTTGYHERSVQRYVRVLQKLKVLIPDGKGPHGTNNYKFPLEHINGGSRLSVAFVGGDSLPPRQPATGDTDSGDTDSGDTSVTLFNQPSDLVVVNSGNIAKLYEQEFGALTTMIADAIEGACETYPVDWIPEAMEIAVKANKRSWSYVEGILKRCLEKQVRPSVNKMEKNNGTHGTSNHKRTKPPGPKTSDDTTYTDADRKAAQRVKQRQLRQVPGV